MKVGDLVSLKNLQKPVHLVNFGQSPVEAGCVEANELCLILAVIPPASSTWGKIKIMGKRGNVGWIEDGFFKVVAMRQMEVL